MSPYILRVFSASYYSLILQTCLMVGHLECLVVFGISAVLFWMSEMDKHLGQICRRTVDAVDALVHVWEANDFSRWSHSDPKHSPMPQKTSNVMIYTRLVNKTAQSWLKPHSTLAQESM